MIEHIKAEPEQILFTVFELERAIKTERERIIKLLETANLPCCGCMQDKEFILDLIKGEQK